MDKKIRVGILHDISNERGDGSLATRLQTEIHEVQTAGRLVAEVEIVEEYGQGLPAGTLQAVHDAFNLLVQQDVVLVVGPAIGDNALAATAWAEAARVPTINWAGAERARSDYMFHLQVGSHEDESLLIARHLKEVGARRIGIIFDQSPIGERHLEFLKDEARIIGLEIAASQQISPLANDATEKVAGVLTCEPDGFVYLGLGLSAPAVAHALTASRWSGPRMMNTAGLRGYRSEFAEVCEGWIYIDMRSDNNTTLSEIYERLPVPKEHVLGAAVHRDLGKLVAEGLARATDLTREGVKDGLERIKWIPSAEGHAGTLLGFGVHDRGALHGRYLVVRQWLDGKTMEYSPRRSEQAR